MQTIETRVQSAFNRAAMNYDQVTPVQQKIGVKLIKCLPGTSFNHVIDLGCGTGWISTKLANNMNFLKFEAIDIAPAMISQAKKNHSFSNIEFKTGSFESLPINDYDLVFSNMALQWSTCFPTTL